MKLTFYSVDKFNEKVIFNVDYENPTTSSFEFIDKSIKNTKILLNIIDNESVKFTRIGDINMDLLLILGKETNAYYKNNIGLEFEFTVYTKYISISNNKIEIEYDINVMDNKNTFKITIMFHKNS